MAADDKVVTWTNTIAAGLAPYVGDMLKHGLNLGDYFQVSAEADKIYSRISITEKRDEDLRMPPPTKDDEGNKRPPLPSEYIADFLIWKDTGRVFSVDPPRFRKNLKDLSEEEKNKLQKAFTTIMKNSAEDFNTQGGYFKLASIHGRPGTVKCMHHDYPFHSWHRAYLMEFENALRNVDGCEDVTLPFWDFLEEYPSTFFDESPFDSYQYPASVTPEVKEGMFTERNQPPDLSKLSGLVGLAKHSKRFEGCVGFNQLMIQVHDQGHGSCGPTMLDQDIAAFDPIFWFFHCNLDRLWWEWQEDKNQTTPESYANKGDWLAIKLDPFHSQARDTINIEVENPKHFANVSYQDCAFSLSLANRLPPHFVKVIFDRMQLKGSFTFDFMTESGDILAKDVAYFQPIDPGTCPNCVRIPNAKFTIPVNRDIGDEKNFKVVITHHQGKTTSLETRNGALKVEKIEKEVLQEVWEALAH